MVRSLILAALLVLSFPSFAGGGWVNDWWNNVYEQRLKQEQYRKILEAEKDKCSSKIRWYEQKVQDNPKSEYYQYKLEHWQKKCSE